MAPLPITAALIAFTSFAVVFADVVRTLVSDWQLLSKALPNEEAVRLEAKNADYRVQLAMAYAKNGDDARARSTLVGALALNPKAAGAAEAQAFIAGGR